MELIKLTNGEREITVPQNVALILLNQGWTKVK